ncbi:hypothetical protein [Pedobacter frigoris]|uniref:hypothetical protein n=1 Tax=Pedobacter frigoris TaxID=2571272 RepID=UPI002931958A|nr:hypothetical protein [Pedobacter frigoris]
MRPIYLLLPPEKASLLHLLFPEEMPALINYIEGMAITLQEQQDTQRKKWDKEYMPFDQWMKTMDTIRYKIKTRRDKLQQQHRLFARLLFSGQNALFSTHCILIYLSTTKHPNHKFMLALEMLFKPL